MRIVVLGSFVQACCWQVARIPIEGETLSASALSIEAGGKGLNVAIGAHRLDVDVDVNVMLGIGQDMAGDGLLQLLEKEGLSTEHVWRLAPQSGYGAGLIADNGENVIAVYPGPNLMLTNEHVQYMEKVIRSADLIYGQFETSLTAVESAFRLARLNGVRTVLNPSPWQMLPKSLLNNTNVLVVNEIEVQNLLEADKPLPVLVQDCIKYLNSLLDLFWLKWQGGLLVVTLGSKGSLAFERNGLTHHVPAFEITAKDSVGAGDAFACGLCIALSKNTPPTEALRYANACGAIVASRHGVLNALPTQIELQAFLGL